MPWVFDNIACSACGSAHQVCVTSPGYPARDAQYVFTCPSSRNAARFSPTGGPFQVGWCPDDYLVAEPADGD
jgi:hypothetical protein